MRRLPFDVRWTLLLAALAGGWVLAALASVRLGAVAVSWPDLVTALGPTGGDAGTRAIVRDVRLPRVVMGGLAGAGLAVAGCAWQGVLRNPLADPYLVGASAGAALGAGAAILFGVGAGTGYALPLLAFGGALGAVAVVYRLASVGGPGAPLSVERLLLAGVAVSAFLSAVLSLAMLAKAEAFTRLYFWLMGGLSGRGWEHVGMLAPYVAATGAALMAYAPRLNALQLGEETARSLGVDLVRDRRAVIALASLLTAAVVSTCGMIGFVGLVVPHLARLLAGPDMRRLLPLAAVGGAGLLTLADLAARTAWAPIEIPVGVLTAMLGAPFFLFLLARQRA